MVRLEGLYSRRKPAGSCSLPTVLDNQGLIWCPTSRVQVLGRGRKCVDVDLGLLGMDLGFWRLTIAVIIALASLGQILPHLLGQHILKKAPPLNKNINLQNGKQQSSSRESPICLSDSAMIPMSPSLHKQK